MSRAENDVVCRRQPRAAMSVLPAVRAGGAELTAVEQQLVQDFRQMSAISQTVMVRFFNKQAERDRDERIAATKPKLQVLRGGAR